MSMPILYAARTSFRKLGRKKIRTFFGIVPTIFLLIFIVLFSGITASIDQFVRTKILSKIELREQIIHLQKYNSMPESKSGEAAEEDSGNDYQTADIAKIKQLAHVIDVQPERTLPGVAGRTSNLVAGKNLFVDSFTVAPAETGHLYNATDFTYRPGEPIPIIVNRSSFSYGHIDMGGKSKIVLDENAMRNSQQHRNASPLKNEFLSQAFDKTKLIGHTFDIQLGGLPSIPTISRRGDYTTSKPTETYEVLSESEIAKLRKAQQDKISPYWNYDQLAAGVKLKFRIVGVNDAPEGGPALIPPGGGTYMYQQLYDLQRAARTTKAIPQEVFVDKLVGLRLTKTGILAKSAYSAYGSDSIQAVPIKEIVPPGQTAMPGADQFNIPGWVYKATVKDDTTTYSEITDLAFTTDKLAIAGLAVTIDDAANREKVQKELAGAGFPEGEFGTGLTDFVRTTTKGLNTAMLIIVSILAGINSLILISIVGRSIADAQREIGVYRALGARKRDMAKLYIVFSTLQTVIGVSVGILIGLALVVPVAHAVMNFLAKTGMLAEFSSGGALGSLFGATLTAADFYHVDWLRIGEYSLALILLTVIVSLIPAWRATRISPVEAIRQAD